MYLFLVMHPLDIFALKLYAFFLEKDSQIGIHELNLYLRSQTHCILTYHIAKPHAVYIVASILNIKKL